MLTTHKIAADFYDDKFLLIAIHSGLDDFAIAYMLNSHCGLCLKRSRKDLKLGEGLLFPVFEWNDGQNETHWTLFSNKCAKEIDIAYGGLFKNDTSTRTDYLMPWQKEVDYFLKIDPEIETKRELQIKTIGSIFGVVTAYGVDTQNLKSKNNLIF